MQVKATFGSDLHLTFRGESPRARSEGDHVLHWLKPIAVADDREPKASLQVAEEKLISGWRLRTTGWNRGWVIPRRAPGPVRPGHVPVGAI